MKVYKVIRSTSGQIGVLVVQVRDALVISEAQLLRHCVLHSPTGMETGYGGSGPADLAASILADYLGAKPERVCNVWRKSWGLGEGSAHDVVRMHQEFKRDFIAPRNLECGESYEIAGDEIGRWIQETRRAEKQEHVSA